MGIDIATYRSRIGCFSHNRGTDVITVHVDVHFSKAAKYTGFLISFTMLYAMAVLNINFSHLQDKSPSVVSTFVEGTILISGSSCFSACGSKRLTPILKTVGAVMFIQLLLLSAGVEPNPGPLPGSQEETKKDEEKRGSGFKSIETEVVDLPQTVVDEPMTDSDDDEETLVLKKELRRLEEERKLKEEQRAKQKRLRKKELKDQLLRAKMDIRNLDVELEENITVNVAVSHDPNLSQNTRTSLDDTSASIHGFNTTTSSGNELRDVNIGENITTNAAAFYVSENDLSHSPDNTRDAIAEKGHGIDTSTPLENVIKGCPVVTLSTSSYNANRSETITLECNVNSKPFVDSVKWEKTVDDKTTQIKIDGIKYGGGTLISPSLIIKDTDTNDEGFYKCIATNATGTGRSQPIHLQVKENSAETPNDVWESIMDRIGISASCKLCFNEVMTVTLSKKNNLQLSDIPKEMLRGLIMLDYKVRDNIPKIVFKNHDNNTNNGTFADYDYGAESTFNSINTQDLFISIFQSCDAFLKQIIVNKMFICRLAIPIIYPSLPDRTLYFSMWPLRSTVFEIKGHVSTEASISKFPMNIVSCIRFECLENISKSKLLNDILSDESHDTFYHRDCPLGLTERKLADGLVEASWYIPAGRESDFFKNVTMFLNLRGDAGKCKKQLDFLDVVSNVVIIVMDTEKAYKHISCLKETHLQTTDVILLLTGRPLNYLSERQKLTRLCKSKIPAVTIISNFRKTASDLKTTLRECILSICKTGVKSLEECAGIATKIGISSDEDTPECKTSKQEAENIITLLSITSDKSLLKEKVLPLQGKLWKNWSEEFKKLKKPGKISVSECEEHETKLASLRSEQAKVAVNLSPFLKRIISILKEHSNNKEYISYFLSWIMFHLDQRSRDIIPPLKLNYHECWLKVKAVHNQKDETYNSLKNELERAEQALVDASLGFEHIIRELGQLYEVTLNSELPDNKNLEYIKDLPVIVSRLLFFGFPIELMDGDAANVPCHWIKTVLDSLVAVIGDKKVMTLSILGVQGSGKSTFLNTMFGLQFPVSDGRCTRGIYAQLLVVDHSKNSTLKFDYILVLDTEGIRSPELGFKNYNHDNELATLILGLGDVTIINIKGSNPAEIKDVLQIAVHAFLRLKAANKNLDLQQSCTFVHHNVPAMNAQQKLQQGTQKLVQNLDNMTAVAAEQENIRNIEAFNQVIKFDIQEDVWYMSDLWHGDPPMAHANPGYSELVGKIKDSILSGINQHRSTFLTFSDISRCIVDLWNGILSDNFVFSFRNSIEMKIYSSMETAYQAITWELEKYMADLLRKKSIAIRVQDSPDAICSSFQHEIQQKSIEIEKQLENFFHTHEYSEILIQWKAAKIQLFNHFTREGIEKSKDDLRKRYEEKRVGYETEVIYNCRTQQITDMAKTSAMELKGEKTSEDKTRKDFECMWSQLITSFPVIHPVYKTDLLLDVNNILYDHFPQLNTQLQKQLNKRPLDHWNEKEELSDYIKHYPCKSNEHVSFKDVGKQAKHWFTDNISTEVYNFTTELSKKVCILFDSIETMDTQFEHVHLRNILNQVDKKFSSHNNDDKKLFSFLPKFQAIVLVHVCRFTVYKFKTINEAYHKRHCLETKIALFKDTAWNLFKNIAFEKSQEIIAANLFSDTIHSFIKKTMNDKLSITVKDKIIARFQHSKYKLIVQLLKYLADKDNFKETMAYIKDPRNYSSQWMIDYIKDFLFTRCDDSKTKYEKFAEEYAENIIGEIQNTFEKASQMCGDVKSNKIEMFMTCITDNCADFVFEEADRKRLSNFSFHNVHDFLEVTNTFLKDAKEKIFASIRQINEIAWNHPIHEEIIDRLWGCEAVCPFCYEPCQGMKNHKGKHTAVQHKPGGIIGICEASTRKLRLESCSFEVQSSRSFQCSLVGDKCQIPDCPKGLNVFHKYSDFKYVIPDWNITPSPDQSTSIYWNWFMAKNINKLAQFHKETQSKIPEKWKRIPCIQAKSSLQHAYLSENTTYT